MQSGACVSNPDNKRTNPDKPRSGYQPVDDDDPSAYLQFAYLQKVFGDICVDDEFIRECFCIPPGVLCEELLRHRMVKK